MKMSLIRMKTNAKGEHNFEEQIRTNIRFDTRVFDSKPNTFRRSNNESRYATRQN